MDPALARPTRAPATTIVVAAACLLGAEGIHTAVIAPHFAEWWAEGAFFLALSVLEGPRRSPAARTIADRLPSRRPGQPRHDRRLGVVAHDRPTDRPRGRLPRSGRPRRHHRHAARGAHRPRPRPRNPATAAWNAPCTAHRRHPPIDQRGR